MGKKRTNHAPRALAITLLALLFGKGVASGSSGRYVALLMGNGAYNSMTRLQNPAQDVKEISKKLQALGFEVMVSIDRSKNAMEQDLEAFFRQGRGAALALFFYAGHGIQVDGWNYLIPVDAEPPEDEAGIHRQAVALEFVVDQVQKSAQTSLIFLDACRNNPGLESRLSGKTRDVLRDIRLTEVPRGTVMVLYAASRGQKAFDAVADGNNSPFAEALLTHLSDTVAIQLIATRVIAEVKKKTKGRQRPEMQGNLDEEILLARSAPDRSAGSPSATPSTIAPAIGQPGEPSPLAVRKPIGTPPRDSGNAPVSGSRPGNQPQAKPALSGEKVGSALDEWQWSEEVATMERWPIPFIPYGLGTRIQTLGDALKIAQGGGPNAESAWQFIGTVACQWRNGAMANRVYAQLVLQGNRQRMVNSCKSAGFYFINGFFRTLPTE